MSAALSATTLGLLSGPAAGMNTTAHLALPAIWGVWAVLVASSRNGLERNLAGVLWATAALMATITDPEGRSNIIYIVACGLALIAGGGINRTAIAAACLASAIFVPAGHKNTQGPIWNHTQACLLISPGWIPKVAALIPTYALWEPAMGIRGKATELSELEEFRKEQTKKWWQETGFSRDVAVSATVTSGLIWVAWLTPTLWGLFRKRWPKKINPSPSRPRGLRQKLIIGTLAAVILSATATSVWTYGQSHPEGLWAQATALVGRDMTMSGRTSLWKVLLPWIADRPWEGWSENFWHHQGMANRMITTNLLWEGGGWHAHNTWMELAIRHGIPTALLVLAALLVGIFHRSNSTREKATLTLGFLGTMSDVHTWNSIESLTAKPQTTSLFPAASVGATQGEIPEEPRNPKWARALTAKSVPTKLMAAATVWAILVWGFLPKTETKNVEFWVAESQPLDDVTGDNWFAKARAIEGAANTALDQTGSKVTIDRTRGGNILRVQSPPTDQGWSEIDELAKNMETQGHHFARPMRKEVTSNLVARAIIVALTPGFLALLALLLAGTMTGSGMPKAITLTSASLLLLASLVTEPNIARKSWNETISLGIQRGPSVYPWIFGEIDRSHTQAVLMAEIAGLDIRRAQIRTPLGWNKTRDDSYTLTDSARPVDPDTGVPISAEEAGVEPLPSLEDILLQYEQIAKTLEKEKPTTGEPPSESPE